jgi:hypothetical protein
MRYILFLLTLLTFTACSNQNDTSKIEGVYKDQNYATLIIQKFGKGFQVTFYEVPRDEQKVIQKIFAATYEDGVIKFQDDFANVNLLFDDGKLIFRDKKFTKYASLNDIIEPKSEEELCKLAVKAFKTNTLELLNKLKLDDDDPLSKLHCSLVAGKFGGQIELSRFQSWKDRFKNLEFSAYKVRTHHYSDDPEYVDEYDCKSNFSSIKDIAIECKLDTNYVYFVLRRVAKSKDGKFYILSFMDSRGEISGKERFFETFDKPDKDPFKINTTTNSGDTTTVSVYKP